MIAERNVIALAGSLHARIYFSKNRRATARLSSALVNRIAMTAKDLRHAASSGEACNPEAARRIADDLEQVANDFCDQLAVVTEI